MFLFIRLYLAHCLGDFPLQTNYIFKLKQKGAKGVLLHVLIITLCCLALCWPYLSDPLVLTFIAFIGVTHYIQDRLKLLFSNPKSQFWLYILDQLFHVGIIALIFLTDLKNIQPSLDQGGILQFYNNDRIMIYLIVLILTTFNGFYLMESFKLSFLGRTSRSSAFEKWFGMLERALLVSIFLVQNLFLLLLPAVLLLRLAAFLLFKDRCLLPASFISLLEIAWSWGIGLLGGSALVFCF